jgi:uncharacterized protein YjbI with pentapeptide repeats
MPKHSQSRFGIRSPRLESSPSIEVLPDGQLADGAGYAQFSLSNCRLAGQSARAISVDRAQFKQVSWAETNLTNPRLADVRFDACDLAGADWQSPRLNRLEFLNCRLIGFKLHEPELRDVVFLNCNLEYAICWSGVFKGAHFRNCVLHGASFEGTDLSGVVFRKCDLTNADFRRTNLVGTDLRGSTLAGLQVGIPELRGAIIDPSQTAGLAGLLGVVVQWLDE